MTVINLNTGKPTKTAAELEASIRLELKEVDDRLFPNLEVTVLPDGEGWKVVLPKDFTIEADRFETILLIADRLRSQFDLNDTPSGERATPKRRG
jgi:hypothetical protein